jgi:hypothetical protein
MAHQQQDPWRTAMRTAREDLAQIDQSLQIQHGSLREHSNNKTFGG